MLDTIRELYPSVKRKWKEREKEVIPKNNINAQSKEESGGLTKKEMLKKYGRFPTKKEWWGVHKNEKEWMKEWIKEHPKPEPVKSSLKIKDKVVQDGQWCDW